MFLEYLVSALVMGFVVAVPPGTVTIVACQRAIMYDFKNSLYFSFGSGVSDVFYIVLVYLGVANFFAHNETFKTVLWIVCGIMLLIVGIQSIASSSEIIDNDQSANQLSKAFVPTFISGILITLTNPMTIVGWLGIAGNFFLIWDEKLPESKNIFPLTIIVIMAGAYLWFTPLIYIVSKLKKVLSNSMKKKLILLSSSLLILFALSAFYFAVKNIVLLATR